MSAGKQLKVWSLTLIAVATMGAGLYSYKSSQISAQAAQTMPEYPELVGAENASLVDYKELVRVPAEIIAPDSVLLTNELSGKIVKLNLKDGASVKKGQMLLQLDISEEQATLKTAKARAELAKADLKRIKALHKKKLASDDALDNAVADLKINQAEVERIQAIIAKKTVVTPFDGTLGLHEYSVGEYLPANSAITNLVSNQGHLWVDVNLSQTQARLLSDESFTLVVDGQVLPTVAQVVAKSPLIETTARSLKHRALLPKAEAKNFTPGAFVEVLIKQGSAQPTIRLPKQAVLRQQATRYVYVMVPADPGTYRAQRRDITLFQEDGQYSYITGGLKQGEKVVTTGAFKMYPNKLVTDQQQPAPAGVAQ
ncbi:hypothetical protein SOPP22_02055 [Shewanella sp. OPT22]|nr:hypothetical protein SOPP22_02055 [Shewanella sp. OPT22]